MQGHTDSVQSVAVSRDNKYVVSGSKDNTIRIWNLLQKTQETVLKGHSSIVLSVTVTSDNKYIISSSGNINYSRYNSDNTVRIWNFLKKEKKLLCMGI